jgi:hypothetical protein
MAESDPYSGQVMHANKKRRWTTPRLDEIEVTDEAREAIIRSAREQTPLPVEVQEELRDALARSRADIKVLRKRAS